MASHASTTFLLTCLADLIISHTWYGGDTLGWAQRLGIAKFNFWCKYGTSDVHPVVVGSPFQRLSWVDRAIRVFLLFAPVFRSLLGSFTLKTLLFSVFLGLLLVRVLGWLDEIMFGKLYRTENAFVLLTNVVSMFRKVYRLKYELTMETWGFLSLRHISQVQLVGRRLSMTP